MDSFPIYLKKEDRPDHKQHGIVRLGDNILYPSHNPIFQHDFNAMWMGRSIGEDFFNEALGEFAAPLVVLLDYLYLGSYLNVFSLGTLHWFDDFCLLRLTLNFADFFLRSSP